MGLGIAQVAASCGLQVSLIDRSKEQVEKACRAIRSSLDKLAGKGKLSEDSSSIVSRLFPTTDSEVSFSKEYFLSCRPQLAYSSQTRVYLSQSKR